MAAYDFLLRGREYLLRSTSSDNGTARKLFRRAIELDPRYGATYVSLGQCYLDALRYGWSASPIEGDRGDVVAVGTWSDGWWRPEVSRKLDTGSSFDVAIADGTYLWVAVFDHTQARHSWHLHPLRITLR